MRWPILSLPIVMAVLIIKCAHQVSSNAVFELELQKFVNHYGKDSDGNCCSGYKNKEGKCSDTCLTKFRVCLKVYQEVIDPKGPCTFGETITPVLGANEVNFAFVKDFVNPLEFKLDSWQGTFSLIIEAWHEVDNQTNYYDGPILLSRLATQEWLDVGPKWKIEEHRSAHSALNYKYRVVCQEHYHGEGCRKWCSARDDSFGHYTCNEKGDRVCLPGWHDLESYCSKAVCSPGCKGLCDVPNECRCPLGWEGPKCDECVVYPGCLHGTCEKAWQCNCEEGWGGPFCNQDLNYCTNHTPCKNGATCFNTEPGSYSCQCPPGFNGTNCEILNDSCSNAPCQNGGTCLDTGNEGFVCQCRASFTGRYCELSGQSCADRPCKGDAPCTDTPTGFQCHCRDGYEGLTCERSVNDCASSPCLNGGSCVDEHKTFRCVCPVGYTGARCQTNVDECAQRPCYNGGECVDGVGEYKCICPQGFEGRFCQTNVDDCVSNPCENGGTCLDKVDAFQCKCRPGWGGTLCNQRLASTIGLSPCASNPCDNGGACKEAPELSGGYRCFCPPGVLGPRCNVPYHLSPSGRGAPTPPMSAVQIVLIVTLSVAVPIVVGVSVIVIVCMKRRRRRELCRHDDEARRQNEHNAVHNAVNNKNHLTRGMIFNSLDYPTKPLNTAVVVPVTHKGDPTPTDYPPSPSKNCPPSGKHLENTYSIVPARSTKTLNTDASRLSLASRLEKDLDAYTLSRNSPAGGTSKATSASHLPRAQSHSDMVYPKRCNTATPSANNDVCTSTHTLTSTCTPSTCTTPSSVYVIEEHIDENYIATEV